MSALFGKYWSNTYTSEEEGDLLDLVKADPDFLGYDSTRPFIVKKLSLVTATDVRLNINGSGYASLFLDVDLNYKLSLDANDIAISSIVTEDAGVDIFIALVC